MKSPALLPFRLVPWLLGGLGLLAAPRTSLGQLAPDQQLAKQAFAELEAASQHDGGKLWGTPLYGPLLLVTADSRRIVANAPDSAGVLHEAAGLYEGELPAAVNVANTAVQWAGRRWAMVQLPLPADPSERVSLLAHESFHRLQPQLQLTSPEADNAHLDEAPARAYLQLELAALRRALLAQSRRSTTAHLRAALAFRAYRRSLYPNATAAENQLELNEGLAEYTGLVLSERPATEAGAYLRQSLLDFPQTPSFVRSFAYQTVPVYGYLLRKRTPDWNRGISNQTDLTNLFTTSLGVAMPRNLASWTASALSRYGGKAILAQEAEREQQRQQQLTAYRRQFVEEPHLIIPLRQLNIAFDPRTAQPLAEAGTIYSTLRVTDSWGILTVEEGALLGPKQDQVSVGYPAAMQARSVTGPGYTLQLNEGWQVVKEADSGNYVLLPVPTQP
ncbi:hypothetical protein [Hymenobacter crusticola]|uniref:Uncharacterized protein n=1 Tax=Hymenobacter crusticola TaxID=1770526 RepID=A0A243WG00_9BACT|nr:hypothetical protein [Hymenobacter crusticola]OUJ74696.1 hypothetical protein BXP70_07995 [Hymenobacter crusticola]